MKIKNFDVFQFFLISRRNLFSLFHIKRKIGKKVFEQSVFNRKHLFFDF